MSNMVPWEPMREMMTLRDAMNRLFEESVLRPSNIFSSPETGAGMPLDVYETKTSVVLKATVPGVRPEDIDVTITGDTLTIKGEFKSESEAEQKERKYWHRERRFGSFTRQIMLPASVSAGDCKASFEHGVLTLEMPKREEVKPKSIKITAR